MTGDDENSIEIRYEDENIWLTQKMMSILYNVDVRTINDHINKIYADDELSEKSTIRKIRMVQQEGNRKFEKYRIIQDRLYESDFDKFIKGNKDET